MKVCNFCGKSVEGTKDAARKLYCDSECYRKHRLSSPVKNKSSAHFRARAAKRESACERCASTAHLQVHHKDRNPLNDSPSNLETLCRSCHTREHSSTKLSACAVCGLTFRAASHRNRNKICSASCASEWGRICAAKRQDRRGLAC